MAPDGLPCRECGEWALRKHALLRRYCEMVTRSLRNKAGLAYLDLLAGPGMCHIAPGNMCAPDSPLIALDYPFHEFAFYEADFTLCQTLEHRIAGHLKADLTETRCMAWDHAVLTRSLQPPEGYVLAYLDIAAVSQAPWSAVARLATLSNHLDLLITLPFGIEANSNEIDAFLGIVSWRDMVEEPHDLWPVALSLYMDRMAPFGFTVRKWVAVRDEEGAGLFYLCLFAHHNLALDFWDKVTATSGTAQTTLDL